MKNFVRGTLFGLTLGYVFHEDLDRTYRNMVNRASQRMAERDHEKVVAQAEEWTATPTEEKSES